MSRSMPPSLPFSCLSPALGPVVAAVASLEEFAARERQPTRRYLSMGDIGLLPADLSLNALDMAFNNILEDGAGLCKKLNPVLQMKRAQRSLVQQGSGRKSCTSDHAEPTTFWTKTSSKSCTLEWQASASPPPPPRCAWLGMFLKSHIARQCPGLRRLPAHARGCGRSAEEAPPNKKVKSERD